MRTYFYLFTLCFSVWAAAYWPGAMTEDSFRSWEQVKAGAFNNMHPYSFSLYLGFFKFIFGSMGAVIVFQLLATALLGAFTFSLCHRLKFPAWAIYLSAFLFATSPAVGLMNTAHWKDIPFSLLVVFWAILCLYGSRLKISIDRAPVLILLGLLLGYTSVVRHNGVVYLPLVPLAFWWTRIAGLRQSAFFGLIGIISYLCVQFPLAALLHIDMDILVGKRGQFLQPMGALIADTRTDFSVLSSEEKLFLDTLMPTDFVRTNFNCSDADQWLVDINTVGASLHEDKNYTLFKSAFFKLAQNNPGALLNERLCYLTSIVLSRGFIYTDELERNDEYIQNVKQNLDVDIRPISESLHQRIGALVWQSLSTSLRLLVWNLWMPVFFLLLALYLGFKGDRGLFASACLLLVLLPSYLAVALAPDWRYFYSLHLFMYFLFPALVAKMTAVPAPEKSIASPSTT